jgi:hypothetical protein
VLRTPRAAARVGGGKREFARTMVLQLLYGIGARDFLEQAGYLVLP